MAEDDNKKFLMHISQEYFGEYQDIVNILSSDPGGFLPHANDLILDLNGSHYETLDDLPTSLEFSKMVRIARPVLMKGLEPLKSFKVASAQSTQSPLNAGCTAPQALSKWTDEYLIQRSGDQPISVAVTPNGYVHNIPTIVYFPSVFCS